MFVFTFFYVLFIRKKKIILEGTFYRAPADDSLKKKQYQLYEFCMG